MNKMTEFYLMHLVHIYLTKEKYMYNFFSSINWEMSVSKLKIDLILVLFW